jgi:hypothetical protein
MEENLIISEEKNEKDGMYMEHKSFKQIIEEELKRKFGKPIQIEYERTKKQYDHALKDWVLKSLFIRAEKGYRKYPDGIKRLDKLLLVGIFNHQTKEVQEFAYNDADQEALLKQVFFNFRSLKERKRLLEQLNQLSEEQQNHTLPIAQLPYWIWQEQNEEE